MRSSSHNLGHKRPFQVHNSSRMHQYCAISFFCVVAMPWTVAQLTERSMVLHGWADWMLEVHRHDTIRWGPKVCDWTVNKASIDNSNIG